MTREFNNRRRDDVRFSARNQPSNGRNQQERPSRTTRPRLSREVVDRAWELGARPHHPDYRPRADLHRQSSSQAGSTSAHNSPRPPGTAQDYRPTSGRQDRARRPRDLAHGNPGVAPETRTPGSYRNADNGRSPARNGRPGPNSLGRYEQRSNGTGGSRQRSGDYRSRAEVAAPKSNGHLGRVYEYDAPRYRPGNNAGAVNRHRPASEPARPARERNGRGRGRSNHSRRKEQEFWEEVSQETHHLIGRVTPPPSNSSAAPIAPESPRAARTPGSASKASKQPPVPRPSQRGFKWPAP
jgi:hypothetical protein